jgi:hypothetical protein
VCRRGVDGGALEHEGGDPVEEGAVDYVAEEKVSLMSHQKGGERGIDNARMPCNPPHICHARKAVTGVHIKDILDAERGAEYPPVVCTTPLGLLVEPEVCVRARRGQRYRDARRGCKASSAAMICGGQLGTYISSWSESTSSE